MHKNGIVLLLIGGMMASCGNHSSKEEPVEKISAPPPVYKMDMLEKIFNNDNWMRTNGHDTSYYYFSRIPSQINVCKYKMIKGDSVISDLSAITFAGDSIVWEYDDSMHFFLDTITKTNAQWTSVEDSPGSMHMGYYLQDEKTIKVVVGDGRSFLLTRTLPLSTFLVRSRYDYLHGTNYAFSDTVFSPPKK